MRASSSCAQQYLADKRAAAERGEIYNPTLAYVPIRKRDGSHAFDTDWTNMSPRISAAWTPSFTKGWSNKVFGDGKTVIRGGYSLLYDRSTTVQTITIPTLGVGFAQTLSVNGPRSAARRRRSASATRPIPLAVNTAVTSPIMPVMGYGELLSFAVDPEHHGPAEPYGQFHAPARAARQYRGRSWLHRTLWPKPLSEPQPQSGPVHVQGPGVRADLRAGIRRRGRPTARKRPCGQRDVAAMVREPLVNCRPAGARTQALPARNAANFINGNLINLFQNIDIPLLQAGRQTFNNFQVRSCSCGSSLGRSNYNGFFTTVRKRFSRGLAFDANYTWSRSEDQVGRYRTAPALLPNNFDLDSDYGPSFDDVTHIFNSNWVYELPWHRNSCGAAGSRRAFSEPRAVSPSTSFRASRSGVAAQNFGVNSGAIPTGDIPNASVNGGVAGSGGIGTGDATPNRTGLNIFRDPQAVYNSVRRWSLSQRHPFGRGVFRGLGFWQLDLSLGKSTGSPVTSA